MMIEILMPSWSQRHHGPIGISIAIKLFQDSKNLKPFRIFKSQNSFMMAKLMAPSGSQEHHDSIGISIAIKLFQKPKTF